MNMPRFTLLQLLAAMTVCGVLFCIAAIEPIGSAVALMILVACALVSMVVGAVTYLATRIVSEVAFAIFGQPTATSPFSTSDSPPPAPAGPVPDLATAVDSLQAETERELGSQVIDVRPSKGDSQS